MQGCRALRDLVLQAKLYSAGCSRRSLVNRLRTEGFKQRCFEKRREDLPWADLTRPRGDLLGTPFRQEVLWRLLSGRFEQNKLGKGIFCKETRMRWQWKTPSAQLSYTVAVLARQPVCKILQNECWVWDVISFCRWGMRFFAWSACSVHMNMCHIVHAYVCVCVCV